MLFGTGKAYKITLYLNTFVIRTLRYNKKN